MPGSSSRVSRTGATRFRVTSGSARSSGMAARSPAQPAPALLTSRSTRPWRSRTRPASRSAPPGSARSTASGSPPVRSAISASATASRPASASVAPRSASSGASASPIPLDAPVTRAILRSNRILTDHFHWHPRADATILRWWRHGRAAGGDLLPGGGRGPGRAVGPDDRGRRLRQPGPVHGAEPARQRSDGDRRQRRRRLPRHGPGGRVRGERRRRGGRHRRRRLRAHPRRGDPRGLPRRGRAAAALGRAGAAGSLRRGALELTAAKEALLDLFVEQGFGAYLGVAMQSAFQVGTQAGLPAEAMVVELYMSGEMARTLQAFADNGFFKSVTWHGLSAAYGGFLRTTEIDMAAMQRHFGEILADIQSGGFARRFQDEQANGYPTLAAIQSITSGQDPMTKAEERVREALAPEPDQAGQRP